MDDLRQIGEFSDRTGISPKRLRVYAAEGVLVPAAVDAASGYRFYSSDQLRRAEMIDALRQAAVPLADIRGLMRHPSTADVCAWERQVDADAAVRRQALARVRELMATGEAPTGHALTHDFEGATNMKLRTAGCSETGPVRDTNEDVVVTSERLVLVADGMGGFPEVTSLSPATKMGPPFRHEHGTTSSPFAPADRDGAGPPWRCQPLGLRRERGGAGIGISAAAGFCRLR